MASGEGDTEGAPHRLGSQRNGAIGVTHRSPEHVWVLEAAAMSDFDRTPDSRTPHVLQVDPAGIPLDLVEDPAWVVWRLEPRPDRLGAWSKAPYQATDCRRRASVRDPSTWATFDRAFVTYEAHPTLDGIGLVLHDAGLVGVDLDGAIDGDGTVKAWAQEIVGPLVRAHWERSPSGRGLRGLTFGALPPGGRKRTYADGVVEMYDDGRFLTITGHAIPPGRHKLIDLQVDIEALHARIFGPSGVGLAAITTRRTGRSLELPAEGRRLLDAAFRGKFGKIYRRIWLGEYGSADDEDGPHGDASSGDWLVASELAYQGIRVGISERELGPLLEDTMRASAAYRPKWDRPWTVTVDDRSVRTTYLGVTIGKAIQRALTRSRAPMPDGASVPDHTAEGPANGGRPSMSPVAPGSPEQPTDMAIELAQARAIIADHQAVIAGLRNERDAAVALLRASNERAQDLARVLRNRGLSSSEARVAIAVAWRVESDQTRGRDESRIDFAEMAEAAGTSKATVGRVLATLSEGDYAPFTKRTTTVARMIRDRETGRSAPRPTSATFVRARHEGAILAALAAYSPTKRPQHGGRRTSRRAERSRAARPVDPAALKSGGDRGAPRGGAGGGLAGDGPGGGGGLAAYSVKLTALKDYPTTVVG
jgi:hypothetical protein